MNRTVFYESMNKAFKNPTGAVAEGTSVHFKITLPRSLGCRYATLCISTGEQGYALSMYWCGMIGSDIEAWECDFVPNHPAVFEYCFTVDNGINKKNICRDEYGHGVLCDSGDLFQLTVYKKGFEVPEWLMGGVMYQIFPDRFCASNERKSNIPRDRVYHTNWFDIPHWRWGQSGEKVNNDYFGGDIKGISLKLPYLKSLGVTCIYLNPIFEAHSNHRYNTADYSKIDPGLGTEKDFKHLCDIAHKFAIRVIIDGVFSHTGDDSVYFNKKGRYSTLGAYNSRDSRFYEWYKFEVWPDAYKSWWGFETLPEVNELSCTYDEYINGENGIVRKWLRCGADGIRLDVADELPDEFIVRLRKAAKDEKPDALILGEVWEDASNKESYGVKRAYLLGEELDTVMNYPFRNAIFDFISGVSGEIILSRITRVLENYPSQVVSSLMNVISTHDTQRAMTVLAGEKSDGHNKEWMSQQKLSQTERDRGLHLMRTVSVLQYTLPGVPCIYYGDEAGLEGYADPFSRMCYPWGRENKSLIEWYKKLGKIRQLYIELRQGQFEPFKATASLLSYVRRDGSKALLCAFNSSDETVYMELTREWVGSRPLLGTTLGQNSVRLPAKGFALLSTQNMV